MTFIYIFSFKEQTQCSSRCAAVAHLVPTYSSGKLRLDCYKSTQPAIAALRTLTKSLSLMMWHQDEIKVITDNHELVWDLERVLAHEEPDFIPEKYWHKFFAVVEAHKMSLSKFGVSESGIMLSSERQLARNEVAQTKWGFAL